MMTKKATLLATAVFLATLSYSQTGSFALKDFDLKGNVKSVNEVTYLGVSKFGELTKGRKTSQSEEKFNKNGFATDREFIYYDEDGEKTDGFVQTFSYDKNNFMIEMTEEEDEEKIRYKITNNASGKVEVIDGYTKKDKLALKQKYKYNAAGKEIEIAEYSGDGALERKSTFSYSTSGDRKEEKIFDKNGKLIEMNISVFDERGNVIEANMIEYKSNGKEEYLRKYKYNASNKKIEERNSISGLDKKEVFYYDDKGNLIKNVSEYGDVQVITYTYDKYGNWIKKVSEEKDTVLGEKAEITEREIRYY